MTDNIIKRSAREAGIVEISAPAETGEVAGFAAVELEAILKVMLQDFAKGAGATYNVAPPVKIALRNRSQPRGRGLADGSFELRRENSALVIESANERGLLDGVYHLARRMGANFPVSGAPHLPAITIDRLRNAAPFRVEPAFNRRAFVSDIMTWHYILEEPFRRHLEHDFDFIPWMARRGINAFSFIRHAQDQRLKINELTPLFSRRGIDCEYGGHVLQLLLPRERFEREPELFPVDEKGERSRRGNLCVSNPRAIALVVENALEYVRKNPENKLLHVWGADVFKGAWCRCGECRELSPQRQYLKVVNAIAEPLSSADLPVAYLAYHDTIEPDRELAPQPNVWFEWAPRERCYGHAIDDPACTRNQRYWDSLRRFVEIFQGRGHIFEYYADAILFGGIGFATPAIIQRDLRAYHSLGLRSISCLTFGAYSVLAYPINLEAFANGALALDFDPALTIADVAAERHPRCAGAASEAYRTIERASAGILTYGDVMRPPRDPRAAAVVRVRLAEAVKEMRQALEYLNDVAPDEGGRWLEAERDLWRYGCESIEGLADYLAARDAITEPEQRRRVGKDALRKLDLALRAVRAIQAGIKGTWGTYDIERFHMIWIEELRQTLAA